MVSWTSAVLASLADGRLFTHRLCLPRQEDTPGWIAGGGHKVVILVLWVEVNAQASVRTLLAHVTQLLSFSVMPAPPEAQLVLWQGARQGARVRLQAPLRNCVFQPMG